MENTDKDPAYYWFASAGLALFGAGLLWIHPGLLVCFIGALSIAIGATQR